MTQLTVLMAIMRRMHNLERSLADLRIRRDAEIVRIVDGEGMSQAELARRMGYRLTESKIRQTLRQHRSA